MNHLGQLLEHSWEGAWELAGGYGIQEDVLLLRWVLKAHLTNWRLYQLKQCALVLDNENLIRMRSLVVEIEGALSTRSLDWQ